MTKPRDNVNPAQRSPSLSTHPSYYIRGGDLYFLCDRILFKVHSHFFLRESRLWQKELVAPGSTGDGPLLRGTSNSNAIVLSEEKSEDFEQFLWVFYNTEFGNYSSATLENWKTILNYSTKWEFPKVQELAIRYLEDHEMDPIQRICLYQANNIPERYLFRLYMDVARRPEVLSIQESRALGFETLVLIHQARERLRVQPSADKPYLSPIRTDLGHADVINIIASTFNLSLSDVGAGQDSNPTPETLPNGGSADGGSSNTRQRGTNKKDKEKDKEGGRGNSGGGWLGTLGGR